MRRITLYSFLTLTIVIAAGFYYLVVDGRVPKQSNYKINLPELRRLANAPAEKRPTAIEVEIIGSDQIPTMAAQAGFDRTPLTLIRTAFRLKSPWGDTLIDVGMDRYVSKTFKSGAKFDDAAMARVAEALSSSKRIVVTHEHPDHLGYLARFSGIDAIADNLRLTKEQIQGTAQYADDKKVPTALNRIRPIPTEQYSVVAPGVVAIPAAGHTDGSMMFYVRTRDEKELLFLGDVVWTMSNIRDKTGRPRLVQYHLMQTKEDRGKVYSQLRSLVELSRSNPNLVLIPSHDESHIRELIQSNLLGAGFRPRAPELAN